MTDSPSNKSFLDIKGLTMKFGGIVAVNDFNMRLANGKIAGIIGPNGAGKTTIFNAITGVYRLKAGEIVFNGRSIAGAPPFAITRMGIARTFQNIRLFTGMDVLSNIKVAAGYRMKHHLLSGLVGLPRVWREEKEVTAEAEKCLELVDLKKYRSWQPENLPYGLQRKLEIARALATRPRLLLLDEPAAGLNPNEIKDLMALIRRIHYTMGITILLIEHHMEMVMGICENIWVVNFGRLIAQGDPTHIQENKEVLRAYLGE